MVCHIHVGQLRKYLDLGFTSTPCALSLQQKIGEPQLFATDGPPYILHDVERTYIVERVTLMEWLMHHTVCRLRRSLLHFIVWTQTASKGFVFCRVMIVLIHITLISS